MTTEQKLERFLNITITTATERGESMKNDYKNAQEAILEQHKKDATRQANYQIQVEKEKAKRDMNTELTRQHLHIMRKISRKQNEFKDKLFDEVKELLKQYQTTEEYTNLLIQQIKESQAYAGNQYIIIYIDPQDESKKEMLESVTGMTLSLSQYSFMGGTRTVIPYKNILIDNSFEKRLAETKENFVFGGSSNE